MKHFLKYTLASVFSALLLNACNPVGENDRFEFTGGNEVNRVVLIEDFTGQNCINCPAAHEVIEQLQEQYGDNVVAVSIHAGDFGIPVDRTDLATGYIGLMTTDGQTLNDGWNIKSWPAGVINRSTGVLGYNDWAAAVRTEAERQAGAEINLAAIIDGNRQIQVSCEVHPQQDIDGALHLWVVESGIVARQRTTGNRVIQDYVHNNVFRASITPIEGRPEKFEQYIHRSFSETIELRNNEQEVWNPDNLSIVAFITGPDGVAQVATTKVELSQLSE